MRIRRVTYDLGNVIERQEYLDGRYGAPGEKRAKKKKATPEEVEQVNQWTRERKARHRLRMYFKVNDYFFTLTRVLPVLQEGIQEKRTGAPLDPQY